MAAQIERAQREIVLVEDAHIRNGPGGSKERTGLESKLGVGIIGVSAVRGWAATAHIPARRALPKYEIRALSAHSAAAARAAGEAFGVSAVFSDHEQMVT